MAFPTVIYLCNLCHLEGESKLFESFFYYTNLFDFGSLISDIEEDSSNLPEFARVTVFLPFPYTGKNKNIEY
jgi:hypothetical protein